jgi:hypothetical protein
VSIEAIAAALLAHADIRAVTGNRVSLAQRPADGAYPALVYQAEETRPMNRFGPEGQRLMFESKLTVTALATDAGGVISLRDLVVNKVRRVRGSIASHLVVDVVDETTTPADKDNDAGVWFAQQSFKVWWYA